MSRYSGCWVGFKCVTDTVESSASVYDRSGAHRRSSFPTTSRCRRTACRIRWPDPFLATGGADAALQDLRGAAYCARQPAQPDRHRLAASRGSASSPAGKTYLDVRQALDDLGIDEADAAAIGIRVYKVAMPWPLEPEGVRQFAEGLEEILVVEEKRQVDRVPAEGAALQLARRRAGRASSASSTKRASGCARTATGCCPPRRELTPAMIARVIAARIRRLELLPRAMEQLNARVDWINAKEAALATPQGSRWSASPTSAPAARTTPRPTCPKAAAPSPASAATCMAIWMDRTHLDLHPDGRRGRAVDRPGAVHRRASTSSPNLGDGTYYHSGLASRSAPRSPPTSTSPTRSSTTTPSR